MFQFELEAAEMQGATSGPLLPWNSSAILTAGAVGRGEGRVTAPPDHCHSQLTLHRSPHLACQVQLRADHADSCWDTAEADHEADHGPARLQLQPESGSRAKLAS